MLPTDALQQDREEPDATAGDAPSPAAEDPIEKGRRSVDSAAGEPDRSAARRARKEQAAAADPAAEDRRVRRRTLGSLPLGPRIAIFVLGWTLVLVGIAGLVLPGIQGILTILAGAALLSLVSELTFNLLRRLMQRWPNAWRKVMAFRIKLHRRLNRRFGRSSPGGEEPSGTAEADDEVDG
jgi:hypothetical protein